MRYKQLFFRIISLSGASNPSFTIVDSIPDYNDSSLGVHTFNLVPNRQNPFEVSLGQDPAEQNLLIKEALDLDLVPLGFYETEIEDGFVYLYINSPHEYFSYINSIGANIDGYINNSFAPVLNIISAPPPNVLLNAYNDNVILIDKGESTKLDATFNGLLPVTLYPSPLGEYYLNMKYPATTLINQNKFEDIIVPDIESNGYSVLDESLYKQIETKLRGYDREGEFTQTLNFDFIKAVEQIANFKDTEFNITEDKYYLLLPQNRIDDIHKVNYYEGFPMDVSLFSYSNKRARLNNLTTGHQADVSIKKGVNRLFFSQGSENFTIDDILPIQTGINRIELSFIYLESQERDDVLEDKKLMLYVNKKQSVCAPYFKFYRNRGGWGYIRFEKEYIIKNKVREGKDITLDFNGIQNTLTRSLKTDRESTIEMEFQTEALEAWEMENFKDFIKSPRVEMYVNDIFQKAEKDSWVGINVKSNSIDNKTLKTKYNREKIQIEFTEYNLFL